MRAEVWANRGKIQNLTSISHSVDESKREREERMIACMRDDFHHLRFQWNADESTTWMKFFTLVRSTHIPYTSIHNHSYILRQEKSVYSITFQTKSSSKEYQHHRRRLFIHVGIILPPAPSTHQVCAPYQLEWGEQCLLVDDVFYLLRKKELYTLFPSVVLMFLFPPITFTLRSNRSRQALNYVRFFFSEHRALNVSSSSARPASV